MATENGTPLPYSMYDKTPVKAPVYVKTRKYERLAIDDTQELPRLPDRFDLREDYSETSSDGRRVTFHKCPISYHTDEELGTLKVYHADECAMVTWTE